MQVLKDDVRNSILDAAIDEFYENGYKDASIRKIAHTAGTTPGNIYAYFSSKLNLFEEILSQIVSLVNDTARNFLLNADPREVSVEMLTDEVASIFFQNQKQFMILMNGSEGTRYANYRSDFCDLIAERLLRDFPPLYDGTTPNDLALHAFSYGLVGGLFYIFRSYNGDEAQVRGAMTQLLGFLFKNLRKQS
jgi:AcrR family transcriptional regulator